MAAQVAHISPLKPASTLADELIREIESAMPELQALSLEEEKAGRLSDRTIQRLDDIGVFRMSVPREYGGMAMSAAEQFRVYTAVGKIAGSTGWVTWVTETHVRWVTMFPKQTRDEVYGMNWRGPRISGVINANGPGRAHAVDGGYMLKGTWPFCSGCRHTAWTFLGALAEGPGGSILPMLMLAPTAELKILDDWSVSGMKATGSNSVHIAEEIFVPKHRTIGIIDAVIGNWAQPLPEDALYRNNFVSYTSIESGATPLGMAKGALDYFMARMGKRAITATDYKIQADAPVTHLQLADAQALINAAELVLSADVAELDRRALSGEPYDDLFRAKIKFDVAKSVRDCSAAVELLHRASGASTIHEANPMQRYARDIRVATVHAQFNYETCAEDYGRALCGKPLFGNFIPPS